MVTGRTLEEVVDGKVVEVNEEARIEYKEKKKCWKRMKRRKN